MCIRDEKILLARGTDDQGRPEWTLPGGGMEHGEDPYDTVLREVEEETGYLVGITGLLGVHSINIVSPGPVGPGVHHHGLRLVYEARGDGGAPRAAGGGSPHLAGRAPPAG